MHVNVDGDYTSVSEKEDVSTVSYDGEFFL